MMHKSNSCVKCGKILSLEQGTQCSDGTYLHRLPKPKKVLITTVKGYPDDNPKTAFGIAKPPLHLIAPSANIHEAMAMKYGAYHANDGVGYGPFNWRHQKVTASTYIGALLRHVADYWDGEDYAGDSLAHHLGHVRACAAIILDAGEVGMLNDDRPPKGNASQIIERFTIKKDKK